MKFRPGDLPQRDPSDQDTPVEWEDNGLSNTLAWASYRLTPSWCQTEDHWTSRVTQTLFTDCPCCLLFRGLVIGAVFGFWVATVAAAVAFVVVEASR